MNKQQIKLFASKKSDDWKTPTDLYNELNIVFNFDFDPCPFKHNINKWNGLEVDWGVRNFVNPPYSNVKGFLQKAHHELTNGKAELCVFLVFANTDTKWFHDYCYGQSELRFIKGRLKFDNGSGATNSAMRPSMLVIFTRDSIKKESHAKS
tara:strand:+ start:744 stop:1196 length:453 start_codon:yes stop_codon:yes gene_type:complete